MEVTVLHSADGTRYGVVTVGGTNMILSRNDDERWKPQFTLSATGPKPVPECFKLSEAVECALDAKCNAR